MLTDTRTFTCWPRLHLVEQFVVVLDDVLEVALPVDDDTVDGRCQPDDIFIDIRGTRHGHRLVGDSHVRLRVPKKQAPGEGCVSSGVFHGQDDGEHPGARQGVWRQAQAGGGNTYVLLCFPLKTLIVTATVLLLLLPILLLLTAAAVLEGVLNIAALLE